MSSPTTTTTTPNPTHNPQDRLSTLPDPLLTNILSRLPITTAITTSTLSTTFHHLWKTTTTISLTTASPTFTTLLTHHIIPHLTSTTLHHLSLHLTSPTDFPDCHVIDSSFRTILTSIAIEKITIDVVCAFYEEVFYPPNSLLSSPPLKELELRGKIQFKLSLSDIEDIVQLPRLRRLMIDYLLDFPDWLGYLVRSCSVLEELELAVSLDAVESLIEESIDLVCPELKRLRIDLVAVNKVDPTVVTLDVPRLEKIVIKDCTSRYCFASDPTGLMDACLDLRRTEEFEDNDEFDSDRGNDGDDDEDYIRRMCRFVLGMSSVSKLEVKVDNRMNVFSCLGCVIDDDGFVRMFRNLVRFEATLDGVGINGWEGLLLSMQRFPNLKHLKVNMEGDGPATDNCDWCPPDIVPDCLTSKLKTLQICGLSGTDDDLKLAAFVLNCARVLEELRLDVFIKGMYDKILGMECVFCQSLFEIPRISSACEVVFSGRDVTTSSSTFKIDQFKGQMFSDA